MAVRNRKLPTKPSLAERSAASTENMAALADSTLPKQKGVAADLKTLAASRRAGAKK